MRCHFGDLTLDTDRFLLERGGTQLHVEPQVFDVLAYLVEHRDRDVAKNELLDNIWGDRFVSESASPVASSRRAASSATTARPSR